MQGGSDLIYQYSGIGARHAARGGENEDAVCARESGRYTAVSLADGVSACRRARTGAEIASGAVAGLLAERGKYLFDFPRQEVVSVTLSHILHRLRRQADREPGAVEDYSSTAAGVVFDRQERRLLCFNLGDGMILAQAGGQSRILSMPSDSSSGCCATTTRNAGRMAEVRTADAERLESVLLCTDGAWRQMFARGRLKPEVTALLDRHDWRGLQDFLSGQACPDDHSFIALELE